MNEEILSDAEWDEEIKAAMREIRQAEYRRQKERYIASPWVV